MANWSKKIRWLCNYFSFFNKSFIQLCNFIPKIFNFKKINLYRGLTPFASSANRRILLIQVILTPFYHLSYFVAIGAICFILPFYYH